MARVILLHLALFALPFVLYALFVYFTRRAVPPGGVFTGAPLTWLAVAGLSLTIAAFLLLAALSGPGTQGVYRPAELRDGRIIPGRIVVPDEAAEPGETTDPDETTGPGG